MSPSNQRPSRDHDSSRGRQHGNDRDRSRSDRSRSGRPQSDSDRRGPDGRYIKPEPPKREGWGRVARKGADSARRVDERDQPIERDRGEPPEPQEKWERIHNKGGTSSNSKKQERPPRIEIDLEASDLLGSDTQRARARNRVRDAASAFAAERFEDARRILKPISSEQAHISDIRELYGLTLYRLGRWAEAITELEAAAAMTGSSEQHPVRADAHRALGQHRAVADLWEELRHDHPGADVITEGRIVMAGSRADQGDLAGAIRVLEQGPIRTKAPKDHHLRLWYALADVYERSGDTQRALRGFERIAAIDRDFADVAARVRSIR